MSSSFERLAQSVIVTTSLVMALPGVGALGAERPTAEAFLCDAISPEINDLSALQFDDPAAAEADWCYLDVAPGQDGPHSVILANMAGLTIGDVRDIYPEGLEVMVGDRTGLLDGTTLYVATGEGVLTVDVDVATSAENDGIDEFEFAIDVAEVAIGNLAPPDEVRAQSPAETSIVLPEVGGISWEVTRDLPGDEFAAGLSDENRDLWLALLESVGADFDQLSQLEADAIDTESGDGRGRYSGIRITGADEAGLRNGIVEMLRKASGQQDLAVEDRDIGGKVVTIVNVTPEQRLYFYVSGGTLHGLEMSEEDVVTVLAALP